MRCSRLTLVLPFDAAMDCICRAMDPSMQPINSKITCCGVDGERGQDWRGRWLAGMGYWLRTVWLNHWCRLVA